MSSENFHPSTFLGNSAFDTIETYSFLKDDFRFSKVWEQPAFYANILPSC